MPADQPVLPAALCLAAALALALGAALLSGRRGAVFCLPALCALFQMYFGLAFPVWVNVPLFALAALWALSLPRTRRGALTVLAAVLAVSLAVGIALPGVDAATEEASERVRDFLSRAAQSAGGTVREEPEGETETRRIHSMTLLEGDREGQADREYRLETVEEEEISAPRWINYLKILLLLLAAVAIVILPFMPFLLLNARRKKALEIRQAFASDNVSEAVCALFGQVIAWLENTGRGAGNRPYREWARGFTVPLSPEYARRFSLCAGVFEEAAYSAHTLEEEQRKQVQALLEETERLLLPETDRKQKFCRRMGGVWIA